MKNVTDSDINQYYTEVLNSLKSYTKFHSEVIGIILAEMAKEQSKYYCFGGDYIAEKSRLTDTIVFEILRDFTRDGLLWVSNRNNETIMYTLTDRGIYCFEKIIKGGYFS